MAELADALASGARDRKVVQVQVLFPAPVRIRESESSFRIIRIIKYAQTIGDELMTEKSSHYPAADEQQPIVRIAVRALAETVYRRGGLGGPAYGGVSAAEGQRLHRRFCEKLEQKWPDDLIETELFLRCIHFETNLQLHVSGRLDALVRRSGEIPKLIEVKSFSGSTEQLPDGGESVHWAQAKIYGWLWLADNLNIDKLEIGLSYINLESEEWFSWQQRLSRETLCLFFQDTCRAYLRFAADMLLSQKLRRQSGLECRFPYSDLRSGQKQFMQEVIGAVQEKGTLLVQAPTGIGKTMAAIYPSVKAMANRLVEHTFYLTAMTSTRMVAAQAIQDLRKSGLRMKALILFAKEKLCLEPDLYCDTRQCPYATSYYDHLPAALQQLFLHETIAREEIIDCARTHQVCPFELALDMALYCEFIICDYNYAFDPRVRLERFFGQDAPAQLLLIDEAHNLPDRSRSMFSAGFDSDVLEKAAAALKNQYPPLDQALQRLHSYLSELSLEISENKPGFDRVEKNVSDNEVMADGTFRAMRQLPDYFLSLLARMVFQAHTFLENKPDWDMRKPLLNLYFAALFFLKIAEIHFDQAYVCCARKTGDHLQLELMCLDASAKLAAAYRGRHTAVFFSATLSPLSYYSGLLYGHFPDLPPQTLQLVSPFSSENLAVMICTSLSTRYQQRSATMDAIREMIIEAVSGHTGNYLVYVPSYAYLHQLRMILRQNRPEIPIDFMFQQPDLSEARRRQYLARFNTYGQKTLLAFAVIGGQFSEGIDLTGNKLSGVIIVGVGLPRLCPEREIMRQYYENFIGQGYAHAYLLPGFNKVQQAAGRVIRSETDRGFVLLIDDRYDQEHYQNLFPAEWQPHYLDNKDDLRRILDDFWGPPDHAAHES